MEKSLEFFLDMGMQILRTDGFLAPVAFICKGRNKMVHLMDLDDKDLAIQTLRSICKEFKADRVIMMAEAFLSQDLSGVRPSLASDREDCIIVQGEDINGDSCAIIQPFYRDRKGIIKFKDNIKQLRVSPLGRMAKILSG